VYIPETIDVDGTEYKVADLPEKLQNLLVEHCNATLQQTAYERLCATLAEEIAHGVKDWSSMNTESIPDLRPVT